MILYYLKAGKLAYSHFNDADGRNKIPRSEIKDSLLLIALIIASFSSPHSYSMMRQKPNDNMFSGMHNRRKVLNLKIPILL